ncbi:MAG: isoaspartyl peptidase/L-asparaginase [Gammaproteobacteria bacterium]|nr:isoaspartyl peptidase/L-asparaginase [Gammaproteobacteria bacterium]
MKNIAFAIHGGAGDNTLFLKKHVKESEKGLVKAVQTGHHILQKGGSALDAVEAAIRLLEDNPLFNAGRGSVLNSHGEVEMDASIMDGEHLKAGAVSLIRNVKNPITLARAVMEKTQHVFLSGDGAMAFAKHIAMPLEDDSYFITEHQFDEFKKKQDDAMIQQSDARKTHGTVGAVALDKQGNLAAGTSTGGTSYCLPGRVGDSCIIGAGCYANNKSCAISGTGEGEYLITGVIAHTIAIMTEFNMTLQEACDHVIFTRNKHIKADMGVISVSFKGDIGVAFNSEIMKRAWIGSDGVLQVKL